MANQERKDDELRKDSTEQSHAPEGFDNSVANSYMSDKGDMGKQGSMQDKYRDDEGYFTMDDDEGKEDTRQPGDVWREGGATD